MHRKLRHCEHHKANSLSNTECIALDMEVSAGKYAYVCLALGTAELVHLQSALAHTSVTGHHFHTLLLYCKPKILLYDCLRSENVQGLCAIPRF